MSPVAFALKAGHDTDSVGAVFLNNQRDFNIREALQEGNGQIVTEDALVIERLDGVGALKRVAADAQADDAPKPAKARSAKKDSDELQATTEITGA